MQVEPAAIAQFWRGNPRQLVRRGARMRDDGEAEIGQNPPDWIAAIAARQDRAAFAALFKFYAPRIKAMLMRQGETADCAEDIAQAALLTVWSKAGYFDAKRASASAWLFTIARNLRVDRLRNDNRARLYAPLEMVEPDEPERPDSALTCAEREERVRVALRELPAEQVRVLQLSFFDGRAHADIAALLNLPLGTVKSRLRLAMGRLRNLLGDLT